MCIIGSGAVGQAVGKGFNLLGFEVTFLDIDKNKIDALRSQGYKAFKPSELIDGFFDFDISFLCVPTPTLNGQFLETFLYEASVYLGKRLRVLNKYHLTVVKSTVLPGTTSNLVIKSLEKYSHKKVGKDFGVCMNPEYLREKSALNDFLQSKIIIIGAYDQKSGQTLFDLYQDFDCPKYIVTLEEAEIQKYVHNLFNALKITFFNEMRYILDQVNINPDIIFPFVAQSSEAIWNPYYGLDDKGPFGGKCLPKDLEAFLSWTRNNGYSSKLLETILLTNQEFTEYFKNKQTRKLKKHALPASL